MLEECPADRCPCDVIHRILQREDKYTSILYTGILTALQCEYEMAIYPLKKENEAVISIILRMLDMKIVDNYEIKRAML